MTARDILLYFNVVKKRWWLIAILCAVTAATILFSFYNSPPVYQATVQFLVSAPPSGGVALYPSYRDPTLNEERAVTQSNFVEVLKSSTVAFRTLQELGSSVSLNQLLQNVTVEESRDSQLIQLTVQTGSPADSAALANEVVRTAVRYYGELRALSATNSREFIEQQLKIAQLDMQKAQKALIQFQIENKMGPLEPEIDSQQALIGSLRLRRDEAEAEGREEAMTVYERLIQDREAELQELVFRRIEYSNLAAEAGRAQTVYDLLVNKETESILKENEILSTDFVQIVEPAVVPKQAIQPFNATILILGLVVSLIAGVLLTLLLEYLANLRMQIARDGVPVKSA